MSSHPVLPGGHHNHNTNATTNANGQGPSCTGAGCNLGQRQVIGKYELGAALAAGDFDCRTRLCSHVVTGAPYVVRIYDKAVLAEAQWMWERVRASIHVQRTLPKHENIVEMVECFETDSSLYILMQLFQSVNVTKLLCSDVVDDGAAAEAGDGSVPPSAFATFWSEQVNRAHRIRAGGSQVPSGSSRRGTSPQGATTLLNCSFNNHQHGEDGMCRLGDLHTGLTPGVSGSSFRRRRPRFTTQQVCNYFTQVVRGVVHMHEHHVVHLGIAPDHILINDRGLVKIGNLVSCCFCPPGTLMEEMKGTRHTVAPEVLSSDPFDPYLADAWSLGILLYFMLNGRYPHDGANTLEHIMYHHIRPPDASLSASAKDLLRCLLEPDPALRMPVSEILQHRFFASEDISLEEIGDASIHSARVDMAKKTLELQIASATLIQGAYRRYLQRRQQLSGRQTNPKLDSSAAASGGGIAATEGGAAAAAAEGSEAGNAGLPPITPGGGGSGVLKNTGDTPAMLPSHGSFHQLLLKHVKTAGPNDALPPANALTLSPASGATNANGGFAYMPQASHPLPIIGNNNRAAQPNRLSHGGITFGVPLEQQGNITANSSGNNFISRHNSMGSESNLQTVSVIQGKHTSLLVSESTNQFTNNEMPGRNVGSLGHYHPQEIMMMMGDPRYAASTGVGGGGAGGSSEYMPCPMCQRPPQTARHISGKPYTATSYHYVKQGTFEVPEDTR